MLQGKTVVVGVCGGIAAYKVVEVVSRLKKMDAEVSVIMTENATKFVAPLTFQSISHNQVYGDMFSEPKSWDIQHISLSEKADLILVAPATANILGKVAAGIADDLLTTTIMASKAPVLFVPAMNHNMYENKVVQNNISRLKELGYMFLEPGTGQMACGTSGKGRLPEPVAIVESVCDALISDKDLSGINVLITAGPTREAIDPVRYISNHSSGKMGYALAKAAASRGAHVKLISGPVYIQKPDSVQTVDVVTADDMYREVLNCYKHYDVLIFAAAVADYKCDKFSNTKIKKKNDSLALKLTKNPDIAGEMGKLKGNRIHIGFSAETDNLIDNARTKLDSKKLDLIVANDVTIKGAGFGSDTNIVKLLRKGGSIKELPIMSKLNVANEILNEVHLLLSNRQEDL
jgi:phosphopantothenoylcysteine decarboxylase/phosphopantothenate--cysteine ligase